MTQPNRPPVSGEPSTDYRPEFHGECGWIGALGWEYTRPNGPCTLPDDHEGPHERNVTGRRAAGEPSTYVGCYRCTRSNVPLLTDPKGVIYCADIIDCERTERRLGPPVSGEPPSQPGDRYKLHRGGPRELSAWCPHCEKLAIVEAVAEHTCEWKRKYEGMVKERDDQIHRKRETRRILEARASSPPPLDRERLALAIRNYRASTYRAPALQRKALDNPDTLASARREADRISAEYARLTADTPEEPR